MALESAPKAARDRFERTIEQAADAVIDEFQWMGLPEGPQLTALRRLVEDAIRPVMEDWI